MITTIIIEEILNYDKIVEYLNNRFTFTKNVINVGDGIFFGEKYELLIDSFVILTIQEYKQFNDDYTFTDYGKQFFNGVFVDFLLSTI